MFEFEEESTGKKRCVIYCRKSSSDGLDREYTSLDCQLDTCKTYIERHTEKGWVFTGQVYTDGGFSGGTTNRPEFQRMMNDVRSGAIDVIVIYKLDRISRNKRDFWNLVHELREYNVTISTATQFIEMETSGGRAATGVMMDFAEYEREIDSERINGQIRAARMAGRWAASATPYGYKKTQDAELIVDEENAQKIRYLFKRYIIVKSVKQVVTEMNAKFGDKKPNVPWDIKHVYKILQNVAYKGFVTYKGHEYKGIHEPLVSEALWATAREIATVNTRAEKGNPRAAIVAEFKGLIKCAHCGGAMIPTYSMKKGKRYVYYKCEKDYNRAVSTCPIRHVPLREIERPIWNEVVKILGTPTFHKTLETLKPELKGKTQEALGDLSAFIEQLYPIERNRIIHALIKEIRLSDKGLDIIFFANGAKELTKELRNGDDL